MPRNFFEWPKAFLAQQRLMFSKVLLTVIQDSTVESLQSLQATRAAAAASKIPP
jgi:hypothetical protein